MHRLAASLLTAFLATQIQAPAVWAQEVRAQDASTPKSAHHPVRHAAAAGERLLPLTPRERVLQLLNRFTFGPRPGDLDQLVATGEDKWLAQQLDPASIPDKALAARLNGYPTLTMRPPQALAAFPDRNTITQVAQGSTAMPADSLLDAVYQVQLFKFNQEQLARKPGANGSIPAEPTDKEKAAKKQADQDTAARIAGDLFALPKNQRMAALDKLPVEDRVAFTSYLTGEQRNTLLADLTPPEREAFNAMAAGVGSQYQIVSELQQAKLLRAILSERQMQEVMTDFWFNHFNIYAPKDSDQWYTTSYERDVIRPHALGKFRDLLLATAQSPAMMVYLDNWLSIGPDSLANGVNPANPKSKRGNKGLNENYGREVMELHSVGVNGGYSQADVTALSSILTGWTVDNPGKAGPFLYDPKRHEPGPKEWLGHTLGADPLAPGTKNPGMEEGIQALTILAASPQTAHFISNLLAQKFLADEPPPALVERMAATYSSTDGDIKEVVLTLIHSPEFNSRRYFRNKVKTPMEFLASAFRATATDPINPGAMVSTLNQMGMPLYYALPPTGYYLTADFWMNTHALIDRLTFAEQFTAGKYANQKFDAARILAYSLLVQPAPALKTVSVQVGSRNSGQEIAQQALEQALLGQPAAAKTDTLIRTQLGQQDMPTPADSLTLLTGLILGSPDFQLR